MVYDLIVAGGGAAGFYGAIQYAEKSKGAKILIVEKSPRLLAKVRISGGGRCNVTHSCFQAKVLSKHYPRGGKFLSRVFRKYDVQDVVAWFGQKGVTLKTEEDGRMFPVSDNSQTIIDCLMSEAVRHKIKIVLSNGVAAVHKATKDYLIRLNDGAEAHGRFILIASGGNPGIGAYKFIQALGHRVHSPKPSLFTFNDPEKKFSDLMGLSVPDAMVIIEGTGYTSTGPVLITHWGLSGPAIIRLSAWAAEYLADVNYQFPVLVNWIGKLNEEEVRAILLGYKSNHVRQKVRNNPLFNLPARLWLRLCELSEIPEGKIWGELSLKNMNRLIEFLTRSRFSIRGKTTFKEEFVTCGGVDLSEINGETMESLIAPGIFFAGEVLNIDGETGGFNFQAAWSTGYIAAETMARKSAEPQ